MPGKATPTRSISSDELTINGGTVDLSAGPATLGLALTDAQALTIGITGGHSERVYIVPSSDLVENGGTIKLNRSRVESYANTPDRKVTAGPAKPVYMINGNIWIPTPDTGDDTGFVDNVDGTDSGATFTIDTSSLAMTADYLMIASISYSGNDSQTITKPSGWSTIQETYVAGQGWLLLYYKFWEIGDTSYTWTFSAAGTIEGGISVYDCVNSENPIDSVGDGDSGNSANPKGKGFKPKVKNTTMIVFVASAGNEVWSPPSGWLKRWQDINVSATDQKNTDGTVADADGTLSASAVWQTVMIAITPCTTIEDNDFSYIDPGTMEYWNVLGRMPMFGAGNIYNSGKMEYWNVLDQMPSIYAPRIVYT